MQKNNQQDHLNSIYGLISELSNPQPDSKLLKTLCSDAGLEYESDLVQLMSKVLVVASSVTKNKLKFKKTSKILTSEA